MVTALQAPESVPRCIAALRSRRLQEASLGAGGHGEPLNTYFVLACAICGCEENSVRGFKTATDWGGKQIEILVSPLTLVCGACGHAALFFDSETDGYDPEACGTNMNIRGEGEEGLAACGCGHTRFADVTCHFAYPDDLPEMEEVQSGELKAENLFTWFKVHGRCVSCSEANTIADFECA